MKARLLLPLLLLGAAALPARAGIILTLQQVGADVVMTSTGSLPGTTSTDNFVDLSPGSAVVTPVAASLTTGVGSTTVPPVVPGEKLIQFASIASGPANFGTGSPTLASSASGPMFAIIGLSQQIGVDSVQGLAGDPITAGTSTWLGTTLAGLGVTPGTYTWTLKAPWDGDTVVLNIVAPADVPAPGTFALLGLGLAGLRTLRRGKAAA